MSKNTLLSELINYISANSSGNVVIAAPTSGFALDVTGTGRFTGALTLGSTITNGTFTYTLPGATGTLALTSSLGSYLPLTGGTLTGALGGTSASFSGTITSTTGTTGARITLGGFTNYGVIQDVNSVNRIWFENTGSYRTIFDLPSAGTSFVFRDYNGNIGASITSAGAATFSSSVAVGTDLTVTGVANFNNEVRAGNYAGNSLNYIDGTNVALTGRRYRASQSRTNNDLGTVGLDLTNLQPTNNVYSPVISFSSMTSGNVQNCTYAAIWGQKLSDEGSWAGGDLIFGTANPYGVSQRVKITQAGELTILNNQSNGVAGTIFRAYAFSASSFFRLGNNTNNSLNIQLTRSDSATMFSVDGHSGAGYLGASAWTYGSDLRLKENVNYIEEGLSKILALKPAKFDYKKGLKNNIGWIAQDVKLVIPEAVDTISEDNDQLTLKSDFIVPYLVKAVQQLEAEIQILKNK